MFTQLCEFIRIYLHLFKMVNVIYKIHLNKPHLENSGNNFHVVDYHGSINPKRESVKIKLHNSEIWNILKIIYLSLISSWLSQFYILTWVCIFYVSIGSHLAWLHFFIGYLFFFEATIFFFPFSLLMACRNIHLFIQPLSSTF